MKSLLRVPIISICPQLLCINILNSAKTLKNFGYYRCRQNTLSCNEALDAAETINGGYKDGK